MKSKFLPFKTGFRSWLFPVTCLLLASASRLAATAVEYPAGGNFDPAEGTVEVWFTPMVAELYPPDDGKYHSVFSLFDTRVEGNWNMGIGWYRHGSQMGFKSSMGSKKVPKGLVGILPNNPPPKLEKGRMCHTAFVWKGRSMEIFVDGKQAAGAVQAIGLDGSMAESVLRFGSEGNKGCPIILHAIRISSVAKNAALLSSAVPQPEIYTLLFDRFDQPQAVAGRVTNPAVIFPLGPKKQGTIAGQARFVSAPAPGLALYPESR